MSRGQPSGRGNPVLRFLDRSFAVVLLRVLGALRRKRSRPDTPARIGIMKSTGIGDMVLATAIANDVVAAFPDAEVVLFGSGENAGLARLVDGVRVVELPMTKPWKAVPALRRERLDALVDLGQWSRLEAVYSAVSGARWTAGFDTPGQRRHFAYDAVAPHAPDIPELENYRALVTRLGVESRSEPSLRASSAGTVSRPATTPYAVFHLWPGGFRSELREWPAESWRELAARVAAEGRAIVLTGGPGDVERTVAFAESCAAVAGTVVSVAGRYGLSDLVDVLAAADCVVSVNTGVMHMAAATGVRTVGLNGPTSSTRWGPRGPRAVSVDSELPGCGFLNLGWEYDGQRRDCMLGISVERVAAAALGDADA